MSDDLESFLAEEETPEIPETPEQPRGEEEPPVPPAETPPPEPEKNADEQAGLLKAKIEETRKRQAAEQRAAELEQELLKERQAKQRQQEEEDPYKAEIERGLRYEFEQKRIEDRWLITSAIEQDKHSDFQEKYDTFAELVKTNPSLYESMVMQPNPAKFMYETAAKHLLMQEIQDPAAYEARIREKVRAEMEAENKGKFEALKQKTEVPPSLSEARGSGGAAPAQWSGPPPLEDIFQNKAHF